MFVRDYSNFYLQSYYKIIMIIPKLSIKLLKIGIELVYGCISLTKKFHKFYNNWSIHCSQNGQISDIVSYNSSQTLKFEHIITFLNSYAPQIWTQPYVDYNIRKH